MEKEIGVKHGYNLSKEQNINYRFTLKILINSLFAVFASQLFVCFILSHYRNILYASSMTIYITNNSLNFKKIK